MADSTVIRGIVKAVSDKYGGALTFGEQGPDGKDVWLAYSKPEYREMGFYEPKAGDNVEVIVSWAASGKGYVKQCVPLNGGSPVVLPTTSTPHPYLAPDGPGWEEPPLSAYGDVPERDIHADVAVRRKTTDESIQLQVAVKVAGEIMVAKIRAGIFLADQTPEQIGADIAAMAQAIAVVYSE